MSANKQYGEKMSKAVKSLVENHTYHKATGAAVFDASKVEHPKGITTESLNNHVNYINDLTAQAEEATAQIGRTVYDSNKELRTIDSSLTFDAFSIKSQHHLVQQVGEEAHYGHSTTIVDYVHTGEQAQWLSEQREHNQAEAAKLFG